jgi:hypothetical protein
MGGVMGKRESFLLYTNFQPMFERLNDAEAGHLIKAIYHYVKTGEDSPISNEVTNMAYMFIKNQLSLDHEKWETTLEKRREAGRRSGEARKKEQNEQVLTSVDFVEQEGTQEICVEHNVNENVNENVNGSGGSSEPPDKKPPLRERDPENDYERVEKAYLENWDLLYSQKKVKNPEPAMTYGKSRKLLQMRFAVFKPEQIISAIKNGMNDEQVLKNGYSLSAMLGDTTLNRLMNASPPEKAVRFNLAQIAEQTERFLEEQARYREQATRDGDLAGDFRKIIRKKEDKP